MNVQEVYNDNVVGYVKHKEKPDQKDIVIEKLRKQGFRITKQRRILLDVILDEECSSCKEIYYKAVKRDDSIGIATVYRMVNTLEDIGVISRKNMYKVACF
jgi:hypothetical protein